MPYLRGPRYALMYAGGLTYSTKIKSLFGTALIGYWPLDEAAGLTAVDASGNGRDGTYTGVTLGQTGIGDGKTAPLFDGVNDKADTFPAGLLAAIDGTAGTLFAWMRVVNAGVWTDATTRNATTIEGLGSQAGLQRLNTDNIVRARFHTKVLDHTISSTAWFFAAITWSQANNRVTAYINGTTYTDTYPAGVGAASNFYIGVYDGWWSGWIAHCGILNREATASEIATAGSL